MKQALVRDYYTAEILYNCFEHLNVLQFPLVAQRCSGR
jgi:hypothetical protein